MATNRIHANSTHSAGGGDLGPKNLLEPGLNLLEIIYDRLNAYAKQVKVNEFLKEEKIESLFDEED